MVSITFRFTVEQHDELLEKAEEFLKEQKEHHIQRLQAFQDPQI